MKSDSAEFFEHIYPYKTKLESSSGGSKQPREDSKENEDNEESLRAVNIKGKLLHLYLIL